MANQLFGRTADGQDVHRAELKNGRLSASVMTWGAVLLDVRFAGHTPSLVLGFRRFSEYEAHSPYFGAIVGRFANRIGGAGFQLDGKHYNTDNNALNRNTLHGGRRGVSHRIWSITQQKKASLTLELTDSDGEMGFPGTCRHTCRYELLDDDTLEIETVSETDAPTIAGLAHHSYFNLDGSNDCRDHLLSINANEYLPVDADQIPTGEIRRVASTEFDFTKERTIGTSSEYDHNFCLATSRRALTRCAELKAPSGAIVMEVSTTEPGLQLYTGGGIDTPQHGRYAGLCLETQNWPDAPNKPGFPSAVLRPGKPLRQATRYHFSAGGTHLLTTRSPTFTVD